MSDEAWAHRRSRELGVGEALRLLGSVKLGRIAFTARALPAIRPVNHLLDGGDIIIRSPIGAAILATHGQIVAYEADVLDACTHAGWSVIITGRAEVVDDPGELARYQRLVRPWSGRDVDYVIRIRPALVTGYEIIDDHNYTTVAH